MSSVSVNQPFPIFSDRDGTPLEDGYIYIGVKDLDPVANPITVYSDADLTTPVSQPIRTLGGFPVTGGTPFVIYAGSEYSIRVTNKNGSLVFSSLEPTTRFSATLVSYTQPGTGAINRSVESRLEESASVLDYNAAGDGLTDDTQALQYALTANKDVHIPAGKIIRVTSSVTMQAGGVLRGPGQIFVDQSTYIGALRVASNTKVLGVSFKGNGTSTAVSGTMTGGRQGVAITVPETGAISDVLVSGCSFEDFIATGLNTGGALIDVGHTHGVNVNDCFFESSNDGFTDVKASYDSGEVIIANNISYSNSDLFAQVASVSTGNSTGTEIPLIAHHVITGNVHFKGRGVIAAGRELGRHGVLAHYDAGFSAANVSNNIMVNCHRHGIYLRGPSLEVDADNAAGPDIIIGNYLAYCGGDADTTYNSGIRVESTLPTIISNNHIYKAGYDVDGSTRAYDTFGIECVRGLRDTIISDNTINYVKTRAINISATVNGRTISDVSIRGNRIMNTPTACRFFWVTDTILGKIVFEGNNISLNGTDGYGFAIDAASGTGITGKFLMVLRNNNIDAASRGTANAGLYILPSEISYYQVEGNAFTNLYYGVIFGRPAVGRIATGNLSLGRDLEIFNNQFTQCEVAIDCRKTTATDARLVHPSNRFTNNVGGAPVITALTSDGGNVHWGYATANNGAADARTVVFYYISTSLGTGQWYQGDVIYDVTPTAGGNIGWVCVADGTPGTWKTFGAIAA